MNKSDWVREDCGDRCGLVCPGKGCDGYWRHKDESRRMDSFCGNDKPKWWDDTPSQNAAAKIMIEVMAEVDRACELWPDWPHDSVTASAIVAEECGELVKAVLDRDYHRKDCEDEVRKEAIQTAAMAIRFLINEDSGHYRR